MTRPASCTSPACGSVPGVPGEQRVTSLEALRASIVTLEVDQFPFLLHFLGGCGCEGVFKPQRRSKTPGLAGAQAVPGPQHHGTAIFWRKDAFTKQRTFWVLARRGPPRQPPFRPYFPGPRRRSV